MICAKKNGGLKPMHIWEGISPHTLRESPFCRNLFMCSCALMAFKERTQKQQCNTPEPIM